MKYPSLLFWNEASGETISPDVFEDLKLTLLLSKRSINALSQLCSKEDIILRQRAYESLSQLNELCASAERMERLYDAYTNSDSEPARDYIFVNLVREYVSFAKSVTCISGESELVGRFRKVFSDETSTSEFLSISDELQKFKAIDMISLRVHGDKLKVGKTIDTPSFIELLKQYAGELELDVNIEQRNPDMQLNSRIINTFAELYPIEFLSYNEFHKKHTNTFDSDVLKYSAELKLYIEVANLYSDFGYDYCMPTISERKCLTAYGLRDLSLAVKESSTVVGNDTYFSEQEPFFFLAGANGGGKTTYLRSVGIAALMARSGFPVTAERMEFYPVSNIFTHFPRDEHGESRLADEEHRVSEIMELQRGDSLILLNETYSTTTQDIASELTAKLALQLADCGSMSLYITHQHSDNLKNYPLLSVVVDSENNRTYKVARVLSLGSSYAMDILKKYGLDKDTLSSR